MRRRSSCSMQRPRPATIVQLVCASQTKGVSLRPTGWGSRRRLVPLETPAERNAPGTRQAVGLTVVEPAPRPWAEFYGNSEQEGPPDVKTTQEKLRWRAGGSALRPPPAICYIYFRPSLASTLALLARRGQVPRLLKFRYARGQRVPARERPRRLPWAPQPMMIPVSGGGGVLPLPCFGPAPS